MYHPEYEFQTVAILEETVNLVPEVNGTTILSTHSTTDHLMTSQEYDQSHIYTSSPTDKLREAIPSGIIDSNEVIIDGATFDTNTSMCK